MLNSKISAVSKNSNSQAHPCSTFMKLAPPSWPIYSKRVTIFYKLIAIDGKRWFLRFYEIPSSVQIKVLVIFCNLKVSQSCLKKLYSWRNEIQIVNILSLIIYSIMENLPFLFVYVKYWNMERQTLTNEIKL